MVSSLAGKTWAQERRTGIGAGDRGTAEGYREPGERGEREGNEAEEAMEPSLLDKERQGKERGNLGEIF